MCVYVCVCPQTARHVWSTTKTIIWSQSGWTFFPWTAADDVGPRRRVTARGTSERWRRFVATTDFISTSLMARRANQPEQFTSDSLATELASLMWWCHSVRVCVRVWRERKNRCRRSQTSLWRRRLAVTSCTFNFLCMSLYGWRLKMKAHLCLYDAA